MTQSEQLRAQVLKLAELGHLSKTACSRGLLNFLKPVLATGVLVEQRSGGGRKVTVANADAFQKFIQSHFPMLAVPDDTLGRAAGVAQFRDSKALLGDMPLLVSIRAWTNDSLVHTNECLDTVASTANHGVFSFLVGPNDTTYKLQANCALVENLANFIAFEKLGFTSVIPLAIYAGGRFSNNLLRWLVAQTAPAFHLIHFPDYDPVGLNDFVRLRKTLGSKVSLHIPQNLDDLFERFSKRALVKDSQRLIPALRTSVIPEVRRVLTLIEKHNAGLEQESLLIGDVTPVVLRSTC